MTYSLTSANPNQIALRAANESVSGKRSLGSPNLSGNKERQRQMTNNPCKGMTKAQREAFERISVNMPPRANDRTLRALEDRGLIKGHHCQSRDSFGVFSWTEYHVPLSIHAQWCEWCSEQPENAATAL